MQIFFDIFTYCLLKKKPIRVNINFYMPLNNHSIFSVFESISKVFSYVTCFETSINRFFWTKTIHDHHMPLRIIVGVETVRIDDAINHSVMYRNAERKCFTCLFHTHIVVNKEYFSGFPLLQL